jgi:hypothetical protein
MQHGQRGGIPVPVLVLLIFLVVGGAVGYLLVSRSGESVQPTVALTTEAADYLQHLQLSEVKMEGAENFLAQTALTISGRITNNGPRTVNLIQINCVFRDFNGQLLHREPATIVGRRTGPVGPGETRQFELYFDNLPNNWNQDMPDLLIAQIQFGEGAGG